MNITPAALHAQATSAITPSYKMAAALTDLRMGQPGSSIYAGTVDPVTVKARRAKNKRARQARAAHRRG